MLSLRQIRRKIRSSQKVEQITKTMQMMAASRFRRCNEQLTRLRPYMTRLEEVVQRVTRDMKQEPRDEFNLLPPSAHPLFQAQAPRRVALVLVTSDRGLCGAYNTNLLNLAARFMQEAAQAQVTFVFVGRRGALAYRRLAVEQLLPAADLGGRPDRARAVTLATRLLEAFLTAEIDAAYLLYTAYLRAFTFRPVLVKLLELPLTPSPLTLSPSPRGGEGWGEGKGSGEGAGATPPVEYIFEPTRQELLNALLPHYVEMKVYTALTEAVTAENSARMMAMKNATDNVGEMIDRFTLFRNKARQAAITKEIAEIVTAAEVLK